MREPRWDPKLAAVLIVELDHCVLAECRAADADVHRHVEHRAAQDGDQLPLRLRVLKMQAPQCAFDRTGEIVLKKPTAYTAFRVTVRLEKLGEEPTTVTENLRLDDKNAWNGSFRNDHHASDRDRETVDGLT